MASKKKNYTNFTTDWEKMYDFWNMTKGDFLKSYSYLTEEEYNLTCDETIGCRICSHEIPRIVTWDDFREAIEVQLHNFRDKYNLLLPSHAELNVSHEQRSAQLLKCDGSRPSTRLQ